MYLRYNAQTGEAKKSYDVPVPAPFIEITSAQHEQIQQGKWFVNLQTLELSQNETDEYLAYQRIEEIDSLLAESDSIYEAALEAPVEFNTHFYKAAWVDDGTYSKLITGALAGLISFPQNIWDITKKEINMVSMTQDEFLQLVAVLATVQSSAFDVRKAEQSTLITEKEELYTFLALD